MDTTEAAPDPQDVIEVEVTDVAYRGKGVARHEGWVVFAPDAWPGERLRLAITRRRRQYGEGRVVEVLRASPHRVQPACPLATHCPGCAYQQLAYPEEVRLKQTQLEVFLVRKGGVDAACLRPPLASPLALGYRNKLVLHAAIGRDGRHVLGYVGADNHTVFDVPACPLARPAIQTLLQQLRDTPGFIQTLRPRTAVTLRSTEAEGAIHWVGDAAPDAPPLTETTPLGLLRVPRDSFFQVNPEAGALLIETVRAWMRDLQPQAVVDLYCGVGVFALAAAHDGVATVRGVDGNPAGIGAARANATALGLRASFACVSAQEGARPALAQLDPAATLLIVDPPRTGLSPEVISAIAQALPRHVLYISCAADTLARDLAPLATAGYRVQRAQLIDMFPRTPYFETAVLLTAG